MNLYLKGGFQSTRRQGYWMCNVVSLSLCSTSNCSTEFVCFSMCDIAWICLNICQSITPTIYWVIQFLFSDVPAVNNESEYHHILNDAIDHVSSISVGFRYSASRGFQNICSPRNYDKISQIRFWCCEHAHLILCQQIQIICGARTSNIPFNATNASIDFCRHSSKLSAMTEVRAVWRQPIKWETRNVHVLTYLSTQW